MLVIVGAGCAATCFGSEGERIRCAGYFRIWAQEVFMAREIHEVGGSDFLVPTVITAHDFWLLLSAHLLAALHAYEPRAAGRLNPDEVSPEHLQAMLLFAP